MPCIEGLYSPSWIHSALMQKSRNSLDDRKRLHPWLQNGDVTLPVPRQEERASTSSYSKAGRRLPQRCERLNGRRQELLHKRPNSKKARLSLGQ